MELEEERVSMLNNLRATELFGRLTATPSSYLWPPNDKPWYPFLSDIAKLGRPLDEAVGNIVGLAVGA
jgi:linoleate 10R-lipoxygenase